MVTVVLVTLSAGALWGGGLRRGSLCGDCGPCVHVTHVCWRHGWHSIVVRRGSLCGDLDRGMRRSRRQQEAQVEVGSRPGPPVGVG